MTDATQAREQAHLDQVIDRIKAAEQEASQKIQSAKKDIDTISGSLYFILNSCFQSDILSD